MVGLVTVVIVGLLTNSTVPPGDVYTITWPSTQFGTATTVLGWDESRRDTQAFLRSFSSAFYETPSLAHDDRYRNPTKEFFRSTHLFGWDGPVPQRMPPSRPTLRTFVAPRTASKFTGRARRRVGWRRSRRLARPRPARCAPNRSASTPNQEPTMTLASVV